MPYNKCKDSSMKTSTFIKQARAQLKLTQMEFARLLNIKHYNLSKYELESAMPPGWIILKVQEILKRMEK